MDYKTITNYYSMIGIPLDPDTIRQIADMVIAGIAPIIEQQKLELLPDRISRKELAAYEGKTADAIAKWSSRGKRGADGQVYYLHTTERGYYAKHDYITFITNLQKTH